MVIQIIQLELDLETVSINCIVSIFKNLYLFYTFVGQSNSRGQGQRKCGICKQPGK